MNSFTFVGKIHKLPEINHNDQGWLTETFELSAERPFANSKGEYECDILPITVYKGAAETLKECAKKDIWICVKGRVNNLHTGTASRPEFVAEKLEFLS